MGSSISLGDSLQDAVVKMSEGNPGALRVLMDLVTADPVHGYIRILDLDDMGIRGSMIWVAFKEHCGSDLAKLTQCLKDRDAKMVKAVNGMAEATGAKCKAVTGGASYER